MNASGINTNTSKYLMLTVFMTPFIYKFGHSRDIGLWLSLALVALYGVALTATSFLPIILYKKIHREWLAISVTVIIVMLLLSLPFWT